MPYPNGWAEVYPVGTTWRVRALDSGGTQVGASVGPFRTDGAAIDEATDLWPDLPVRFVNGAGEGEA